MTGSLLVRVMAKKSKRKKIEDEYDDDVDPRDDIDDSDPFGLGNDFYDLLNDQLKNVFKAFPGMSNLNMTGDSLKKMYADIFRRMNIDPRKLKEMDPKDLQELIRKGKFVFGMNMGIDGEGKPTINSFGNVQPTGSVDSVDPADNRPERDPLVDILEEDGYIVVVCEVPGVEKKDIEIRASSNELEIIAHSGDAQLHGRHYHKTVALPAEINPDFAKARYQNGILEVRLQKIGEKKPSTPIPID
ncbi:MAG: Hsp20/alpha crystallin family protein [Promethearchaeota archaeon]